MPRLIAPLAWRTIAAAIVSATLFTGAVNAHAQEPPAKQAKDKAAKDKAAKDKPAKDKSAKDTAEKAAKIPDSPLFRSEAVFDVTLTTNLKNLKRDKGDKAPYHPATLTYADSTAPDGKRVVPVRVRTRGIWRLKNCDFPPIRLNFTNKEAKGSVFHDLDEPKLVSYCRNTSTYEEYLLQEFQLYRVYRLLTPVSHRVRLVRMSYADSASGKIDGTHYAFISEDPAHVATVNGGKIVKVQGAGADDLEPAAATMAYMFQYFIGNTDFSFSGLHNAEIVSTNTGMYLPIAYDFDFSGAVNATYATPDPSLPIRRVRDRLYRGFCAQNAEVPKVLEKFKEQKSAIYALYTDALGSLLKPGTVKETLSYFDEFYKNIATPKDVEKQILSECRKLK